MGVKVVFLLLFYRCFENLVQRTVTKQKYGIPLNAIRSVLELRVIIIIIFSFQTFNPIQGRGWGTRNLF